MESQQTLVLSLIPASGDATDSAWQEECRGLLETLRSDPALDARPTVRLPSDPDARALGVKEFNEMAVAILGSASAGAVASHIWDLLTSWLKRRRGCSCVIRTTDGEFTFGDLTKEEALRLLSSHLRRSRQQASR